MLMPTAMKKSPKSRPLKGSISFSSSRRYVGSELRSPITCSAIAVEDNVNQCGNQGGFLPPPSALDTGTSKFYIGQCCYA